MGVSISGFSEDSDHFRRGQKPPPILINRRLIRGQHEISRRFSSHSDEDIASAPCSALPARRVGPDLGRKTEREVCDSLGLGMSCQRGQPPPQKRKEQKDRKQSNTGGVFLFVSQGSIFVGPLLSC